MDQATADRIAHALESIAKELAAAREAPQFIPTGFAVVTPEELKRRQLHGALGGFSGDGRHPQ